MLAFAKYFYLQIQPHKYPPWDLVKGCLVETFINQIITRPIVLYLAWPLFAKAGVTRDAPIPSVRLYRSYSTELKMHQNLFI